MSIKRKNIPKLVGIITIGLILLFVSWLWYLDRYDQVLLSPNTFGDFGEKKHYMMDPETTLATLDRGEIDVFTPQIAAPEKPISEQPFEWHQADFLKVASVLNQHVWDDTLNGWSLYYINFIETCHDNPKGFEFGEIAYFKTVPHNLWQNDYTVRAYQISPQYGNVISSGGANFPQPLFDRWNSINFDQIEINAEDALRIAEENGGKEARLSVQNMCNIQARLSGDFGWRIFIHDDKTGSSIFGIEIDPYTGIIK